MDTFEAFVERLDKYPKIEVGRLVYAPLEYHPAVVDIYPRVFNFRSKDKHAVESYLMEEVNDYIRGADKVWVRVLPEVTVNHEFDGTPNGYSGYARIAIYRKGVT